MIQIDEHIFQMGWFNHQLDVMGLYTTQTVWDVFITSYKDPSKPTSTILKVLNLSVEFSCDRKVGPLNLDNNYFP